MEYKIGYYIQRGGDGTAYPRFYESENLAVIAEKFSIIQYDEGWSEDSATSLTIESDSPIKVKGVDSYEDVKKEIEEELQYSGNATELNILLNEINGYLKEREAKNETSEINI